MVYQAEKFLEDMKDKIGDEDKSAIEASLDSLKTALSGSDTGAIKAATEALTQTFYKISEKIYNNPAQGEGPADTGEGQDGAPAGDGVYDADYEVVDDSDNDRNE